jgi:hypothetical protein
MTEEEDTTTDETGAMTIAEEEEISTEEEDAHRPLIDEDEAETTTTMQIPLGAMFDHRNIYLKDASEMSQTQVLEKLAPLSASCRLAWLRFDRRWQNSTSMANPGRETDPKEDLSKKDPKEQPNFLATSA